MRPGRIAFELGFRSQETVGEPPADGHIFGVLPRLSVFSLSLSLRSPADRCSQTRSEALPANLTMLRTECRSVVA